MKAYILSIAGVILIASVVTVIAPGGKMGQFVKGMARLFLLAVMIAPVFGLVKGEAPVAPAAVYEEDADYFDACAKMLEARDEAAITAYLQEKFNVSAIVDVKRSRAANFDREKIFAEIAFQGIIGEDERINILTRIREDLETVCGCTAEVT